ncbi:MAG TPA: hypothetical protein VLG37_05025 [Candidatus Saccharimonadales bacterium]|nr:hypothetical protein [Candidatus Saccharimonadales bacterium]
MDENLKQIAEYINEHLRQGVPEQTIREHLRKNGWNDEWTNKAFAAARHHEASPLPTPVQDQPTAPKKYRVSRALKDVLSATRHNGLTFLLSVVISYILVGFSLLVVGLVIGKVLYGRYGLILASTSRLLVVLFGSLVLYTVWYAFAYAFVLSAASLAIRAGSEKRKSSLGANLSTALAATGRVGAANTLFALASLWPIILSIFLPSILLTRSRGSGSPLVLSLILILAALVWIYIAVLRFALAPYVALFEPGLPITKSLARSKHLLEKGGQWFLVKGFFGLVAILIILSRLTNSSIRDLNNTHNIWLNLSLVVLSMLTNGALVMLYLNRRAVRD